MSERQRAVDLVGRERQRAVDLVGGPSRRWCGDEVDEATRPGARPQEGTA